MRNEGIETNDSDTDKAAQNRKAAFVAGTTEQIVWAIDAFPDQEELLFKTALALQALFPNASIHPVYVLSEENFTSRGISSFLKPALKPMASKAARRLLSQFKNLNLDKPRVLREAKASVPACARKLLRFAKRIGASRIALGSHGKSGISRLFYGSFSEAIMDQSSIPVIVAGPRMSIFVKSPDAIVFPTDFSAKSGAAFAQILRVAASFHAEVHLFHKTLFGLDNLFQGGIQMLGGGWTTIEPYLGSRSTQFQLESRAQHWMGQALSQGVKTRLVSENFREPTSIAIVEYVYQLGEASTLLAMVTQTGPVASALLGSVTREVIQRSPCPVYLLPRSV